MTTHQAQVVIDKWLKQCNHIRPHYALGMRVEAGEPALLTFVPERPHVSLPRVLERRNEHHTVAREPPISTSRSPKSVRSCRPGGVSNRTVANASAFSPCR